MPCAVPAPAASQRAATQRGPGSGPRGRGALPAPRSLAVFRCEGPRDATRCLSPGAPPASGPPHPAAELEWEPDLNSLSSSLTSRPVDPAPQPLPPIICQPRDKGWPWAGTGPASWPQAARLRSPPVTSAAFAVRVPRLHQGKWPSRSDFELHRKLRMTVGL